MHPELHHIAAQARMDGFARTASAQRAREGLRRWRRAPSPRRHRRARGARILRPAA